MPQGQTQAYAGSMPASWTGACCISPLAGCSLPGAAGHQQLCARDKTPTESAGPLGLGLSAIAKTVPVLQMVDTANDRNLPGGVAFISEGSQLCHQSCSTQCSYCLWVDPWLLCGQPQDLLTCSVPACTGIITGSICQHCCCKA